MEWVNYKGVIKIVIRDQEKLLSFVNVMVLELWILEKKKKLLFACVFVIWNIMYVCELLVAIVKGVGFGNMNIVGLLKF